jgi:hypothetical protein
VSESCGTCGHWGGHPERTPYAFCYAKKVDRPLWTETLYPFDSPVTSRTAWKVLDQSPRMPFNDGAGCKTWKQTKRGAAM